MTRRSSDPEQCSASALSELRRRSGLTWEQLFGVSCHSVCGWASGAQLSTAHKEHLMGALSVIRWADRGSASSTRAALLSDHEGERAFELLGARRFDEACEALGRGEGQRPNKLGALSAEAKAARRPLPPLELFDAVHERIHIDLGRARAARVVRVKRHDEQR